MTAAKSAEIEKNAREHVEAVLREIFKQNISKEEFERAVQKTADTVRATYSRSELAASI